VRAFRILTDLTLLDIAAKKPRDGVELLEIGGIGPSRLEKYGTRILRIVKDPLSLSGPSRTPFQKWFVSMARSLSTSPRHLSWRCL
jgi:HRDC domain